MKIFPTLFLGVLIIPFLEIYLLIQVGGIIGAFPTILLVVFTAVLGAWLLKQQGLATFQRFQESLAQGVIPAYEMVEGPIILVGGALLLTPGFITDIIGFACLIPQFRRRIAQYVIEHYLVQAGEHFQQAKAAENNVLEGEFRKEE
ncbi:FxsA family protein [Methylobacter sp.]|uniref:FxsA family protein n=1 Tax=Methylobacter sp. TaxID=2051955 RepID=UPI002FDDD9E8